MQSEEVMLSFYDALCFSIQKRNLMFCVCLALIVLLCFIATGIVLEKDFVIFSALKNALTSTNGDITKFGSATQLVLTLKQISFWSSVYPKAVWIVMLFLVSSLVFFVQALLISKKQLFHLPETFSLPFLVNSVFKMLLILLPITTTAYVYTKHVLFSVFSFGIQTAMNMNPMYNFPFSQKATIIYFVLCIIYLYYVLCLFIDRFSFRSLVRIKCLIKHFTTVLELIFWHIIATALLLVAWCGLLWILSHLDISIVCFGVLFTYLSLMIVMKEIRFVLTLPVIFAGITMLFGKEVLHNPMWTKLWPLSMGGFLSLSAYFIVWFLFLSIAAHLFSQTAFVLRFNKTPSSDIKDTEPEKMRRMEEIYDEYLQKHNIEKQDNFFDHIELMTKDERKDG